MILVVVVTHNVYQLYAMDPQFPTPVAYRGQHHRAIIQGAEYET